MFWGKRIDNFTATDRMLCRKNRVKSGDRRETLESVVPNVVGLAQYPLVKLPHQRGESTCKIFHGSPDTLGGASNVQGILGNDDSTRNDTSMLSVTCENSIGQRTSPRCMSCAERPERFNAVLCPACATDALSLCTCIPRTRTSSPCGRMTIRCSLLINPPMRVPVTTTPNP